MVKSDRQRQDVELPRRRDGGEQAKELPAVNARRLARRPQRNEDA